MDPSTVTTIERTMACALGAAKNIYLILECSRIFGMCRTEKRIMDETEGKNFLLRSENRDYDFKYFRVYLT